MALELFPWLNLLPWSVPTLTWTTGSGFSQPQTMFIWLIFEAGFKQLAFNLQTLFLGFLLHHSISTGQTLYTVWDSLRSSGVPPRWLIAVWFPLAIPKCSFTSWLAFKNRLLTKDRMQHFGMTTNPTCILCNNANETALHLFCSDMHITLLVVLS